MTEPEGLAAALLAITQHAERIGVLDGREDAHHREITGRLTDLQTAMSGLRDVLADQAEALAGLADLDRRVAAIAGRLASIAPEDGGGGGPDGDLPAPSVRWWKLAAGDREDALARLAGWVEQIYRPFYGHVSASLGGCWQAHLLCLFTLDWLSELWAVLYLQPSRTARTLAGQAEFQTRILPAAADLMALETARCKHGAGGA